MIYKMRRNRMLMIAALRIAGVSAIRPENESRVSFIRGGAARSLTL